MAKERVILRVAKESEDREHGQKFQCLSKTRMYVLIAVSHRERTQKAKSKRSDKHHGNQKS